MEIQTDFLVLGSGIAGLGFAIKAARLGTVAIVTKKEIVESSTNYAQGGIASVMDRADSVDSHVLDTLDAGDGLCNEEVVRFVVTEGPDRIRELIDWGVRFSRATSPKASQAYDLGREGGHSHRRVLHAEDFTGREIERALVDCAGSEDNIRIFENHFAVNLITLSKITGNSHESDRCLGAYVYDLEKQTIHTFRARFIIMATGGSGKVYRITTNPDIATGDGLAMAFRAGALISNMEFFQFHPTCLYHPEAKSFLISEAVRGEGGTLKLQNGSTFMENYHRLESLAPRDVVAQAIDRELKKSGDDCVYLDIRHRGKEFLINRFPHIYRRCLDFGVDMARDLVPVAPAAHYQCGGVAVNEYGETTIDRLFACGEVSGTGLHGANRLASNSLLEAVVFAHRIFTRIEAIFEAVPDDAVTIPPWDPKGAVESDELIMISNNWNEIRVCMSNYVGIVRSDKRLHRAKRRIDLISQEINEYYWNFKITTELLELRNIATVAQMIIACSQMRKESRGLHFNIDHPQRDDDTGWRRDTIVSQDILWN